MKIVDKILEIFNRESENKVNEAQINTDIKLLGIDSLLYIRILVSIEEEFDMEIPDEFLYIDNITIQKIADIVSQCH